MTDSSRAMRELAEVIAVGEGPTASQLAGRIDRRRRVRGYSTAAGLAVAALVAALLVPGTLHAGSGAPARTKVSQGRLLAVALAAGRHALAAAGGPPVGSMSLIGPGQLWVLDGDGLFLSSDGGVSWRPVAPTGAGDPLANYDAIDFLSLRTGWVVVSRVNTLAIDRTTDGGKSWESAVLPASLYPRGWNGAEVGFTNARDGWALVQPYEPPGHPVRSVELSSTDGGSTWTVVGRSAPVVSAKFTSPAQGWGLGDGGTSLFRTTDGGISWTPVALPRPSSASSPGPARWNSLTLPVFDGQHVVLLAVPASRNAVTESSTDGGRTWVAKAAPFAGEPAYPQAGSPGSAAACADCIAVGDEPFAVLSGSYWRYWAGQRLYTTTDAGRSWTSIQPDLSFATLGTTLGRVGVDNGGPSDPLQFTSPLTGWALASTSAASGQQSVLLVSTDAGAVFTAVSPPRI
jgi:photosystem II stability/assembly factor-like uncharacterized protein